MSLQGSGVLSAGTAGETAGHALDWQVKSPRRGLLLDCRYESRLWDTEKTLALAHQQRVLWGLPFFLDMIG